MSKKVIFTCLSGFSILMFTLMSCKHETTPPVIDDNSIVDTVYFYDAVLPVIQTNCAYSGCHSGEQNPNLSNYSGIMKLVTPGDAKNSRLYSYAIGNQMPPSPKTLLNLEQVTSIYAWIKQGALENSEPCDTSVYTFNTAIFPLIKRNCLGCHNTASANGELTNESQISEKAVAILGRVTGQNGNIMPPSPANPLSDCKINKIKNWINNGKPTK